MSRVAPPRTARRTVLTTVLVGALFCAGCTSPPRDPDVTVTVSPGGCGQGWDAPHGGEQTFQLHNTGAVTAAVELTDPDTGGVYAEVEALAAGTTRPMHLTLGRGVYAFRCLPDGTDAVNGPTVRLDNGPSTGTPAVLPVSEQDLTGAVDAYRSYVNTGLAALATDVAALRGAVHAGDLTAARRTWLTAHLAYERLGAAYGTFDEYADKLDGLPDGLPGGVHDPDFIGFHRVEYGLWHGESLTALRPVVDRLAADVAGLRQAFPQQRTDANDLPLRAHEIMEMSLRFELTGAADQGSGSNLGTVAANLDGTRAVLDALAPVLTTRYPDWPRVNTWLDRTRDALAAGRRPDGGWIPVGGLDPAARQRLDGAIGQLLELLAPIAAIGEVRRTS